jgi:hypothetical protein
VVELRLLSELPTPRAPRIARNTIEVFRPSLAAHLGAPTHCRNLSFAFNNNVRRAARAGSKRVQ